MRTIQLILLMCVAVGAAQAQITTKLVSVPNGLGPDTATYDLVITVEHPTDWTSTAMTVTLTGGSFFHHPIGGNTQPDPTLLTVFPTLAWDTFVTCPQGWPNVSGVGGAPGFAGTPIFAASNINATWFDTPPNGGSGSWTIARLTVQGIAGPWSMQALGAHTHVHGGNLIPFLLVVPEPGSATPFLALALPALMARARRCRGPSGGKRG